MPGKKQLRERIFLFYGLRAWSITAEEARGQERGMTGHTTSAVRKEEKWTLASALPAHGMALATFKLFPLHWISLEIPSRFTRRSVSYMTSWQGRLHITNPTIADCLPQVPPAALAAVVIAHLSVRCYVHSDGTSRLWVFKFSLLCYTYLGCVCVLMFTYTYTWKSKDNLWGSVLFFYHADPWDQIQVSMLSSEFPYSMSFSPTPTTPRHCFLEPGLSPRHRTAIIR